MRRSQGPINMLLVRCIVWVVRGLERLELLAPATDHSVMGRRLIRRLQRGIDLLVTDVFLVALSITPLVQFDVSVGV